jgi:hypothetical protein
MAEDKKVEQVTFDNETYAVKDLNPEILAMFNMLIRLTREIEDAAYNLQKLQGSQAHYAGVAKAKLKEDGIEPQPAEAEVINE